MRSNVAPWDASSTGVDDPHRDDGGERDRDDRAVDRGRPVESSPGQLEQGDGEDRVGGEVQHVRERVAVGAAEATLGDVEDHVARDEQDQPEGEELPGAPVRRRVPHDPVDRAAGRHQAQRVEEERPGVRRRQQRRQEGQPDPRGEEAPDGLDPTRLRARGSNQCVVPRRRRPSARDDNLRRCVNQILRRVVSNGPVEALWDTAPGRVGPGGSGGHDAGVPGPGGGRHRGCERDRAGHGRRASPPRACDSCSPTSRRHALAATVGSLSADGADVVGVRTDVSVAADVEALRDQALDAFGAVHVICNNAGVGGAGIVGAPLEVWEWVIGVNLWGVVHGVHTFLPLLLDQNEGHIVNTASLAGLGGVPGLGVYCTTKFAVVGLSESLSYDLEGLGSEVGVSVLCPGFVQTQIGESVRNAPGALAQWTDSEGRARVARHVEGAHGGGDPARAGRRRGVRGGRQRPVLRVAARPRGARDDAWARWPGWKAVTRRVSTRRARCSPSGSARTRRRVAGGRPTGGPPRAARRRAAAGPHARWPRPAARRRGARRPSAAAPRSRAGR